MLGRIKNSLSATYNIYIKTTGQEQAAKATITLMPHSYQDDRNAMLCIILENNTRILGEMAHNEFTRQGQSIKLVLPKPYNQEGYLEPVTYQIDLVNTLEIKDFITDCNTIMLTNKPKMDFPPPQRYFIWENTLVDVNTLPDNDNNHVTSELKPTKQ